MSANIYLNLGELLANLENIALTLNSLCNAHRNSLEDRLRIPAGWGKGLKILIKKILANTLQNNNFNYN